MDCDTMRFQARMSLSWIGFCAVSAEARAAANTNRARDWQCFIRWILSLKRKYYHWMYFEDTAKARSPQTRLLDTTSRKPGNRRTIEPCLRRTGLQEAAPVA